MDSSGGSYQATTTQQGNFDANTALLLSETKDEINRFILDLIGLRYIEKERAIVLERFKKPTVTYEFASDLMQGMYMQINRISARTDFSDNQIAKYNLMHGQTLIKYLGTLGMRSLVSDDVWLGVVRMTEKKEWENYGIDFDYNKPFTQEMLLIVKYKFDIQEESFGQNVILSKMWDDVAYFIHSGRNRAKDKLTLDHEKAVYKETSVHSLDKDRGGKEGFLRKLTKAWS